MNYNDVTIGIVTFKSEKVIFNCLKSIKNIKKIIIFDNSNDIELKLNSYLHHRDYEVEKLGIKKITEVITKNETIYDMYGDKRSKKFKDDKRKKLDKCDINILPKFVQNNIEKFKNWID